MALRLIPRAGDDNDLCTLDTCPIEYSYYDYRPSLAANATFLAIFSLALLCFLLQGFLTRKFLGFTVAVMSGCILEILGYIGRLMSHANPFNENGFLMQICCLTIGPAFLAAAVYLTISHIVTTFGPQTSRISPKAYPRIFITCDVISLILQATGGGMASVAAHANRSPDTGDHIMVAGLAFQVLTLALFIALCADYAFRTYTHSLSQSQSHTLTTPTTPTRPRFSFALFLVALAVSTLCIFVRSVYRVVELAEGWGGALIKNQRLFVAFEGALMVVAVGALNGWHPGRYFGRGWGKGRREGVEVGEGKGVEVGGLEG